MNMKRIAIIQFQWAAAILSKPDLLQCLKLTEILMKQ